MQLTCLYVAAQPKEHQFKDVARLVCHNLGCGCVIWQKEFDQQSLRTMELQVTLDIKTQSIQCKCYNVHFCCFELISDTANHMHKAWVSQNCVLEGATVTWWTQ